MTRSRSRGLVLALALVACTRAEPRDVEATREVEVEIERDIEVPARCRVGAPPDLPGRRASLRAWARSPGRDHATYLPLHALRFDVALFGEHVELDVELEYENPWDEPITLVQPIVARGWTPVDHVVQVGARAHREGVVAADEALLVQAAAGVRVRERVDTELEVREIDEVGPGESIRVELSFARRLAVLEPGRDLADPDVLVEPAPTPTAQLALPQVGGCVAALELAVTIESSHALPPLAASSHALERRELGTGTRLELRETGAQPADVTLAWPLTTREPEFRSARSDPRARAIVAAVEQMHAAGPWPRRGSCFPEPGQLEHDLALALAHGISTVQTCRIAWVEEAGLHAIEPMQPRCDAAATREPFGALPWVEPELDAKTLAQIEAYLAHKRKRVADQSAD